ARISSGAVHSFRGRSGCGKIAFLHDSIDAGHPGPRPVAFISVARGARHCRTEYRTTRMNRYICDADDFYVNVNLNTEMELPNNRDTVLHFFEQMKKGFPELRNF